MSLAVRPAGADAALLEQTVIKRDLRSLTQPQRLRFYQMKCSLYGLDWRTAPFDYLDTKQGLTLYLNANGAAQLRRRHRITITDTRYEYIQRVVCCYVT